MIFFYLLSLLSVAVSDPQAVWPKPAQIKPGSQVFKVSEQFKLVTDSTSTELEEMMDRYVKLIQTTRWIPINPGFQAKDKINGTLNQVKITVTSDDINLNETTDESYTLKLAEQGSTLVAKTIYGARHGLETLYQMIQYQSGQRLITKMPLEIVDQPKYKHRGLLLDTSHNFFPLKDIKRTIETMGRNKMNVFHWHIVDSGTWLFQSHSHTLLLNRSVIFHDQFYTYKNISHIVAFAKTHGVRVIPELQVPIDSYAVSKAYPELMICKETPKKKCLLDITNVSSIALIDNLIDEFIKAFPDARLHLSGTNVKLSNYPAIENYIEENPEFNTAANVSETFAKRIYDYAKTKNKDIMVNGEMVSGTSVFPKNTLVQATTPDEANIANKKSLPFIVASANHWHLNCTPARKPTPGIPQCNSKTWQEIYTLDLQNYITFKPGTAPIGGEVALFSQQADTYSLDYLLWPRSSAAAAEVLWAEPNLDGNTVFIPADTLARLSNFRFRLLAHGIKAMPLQSLLCAFDPTRCDID
ncbi:Glucosamine-6-phosphate isomerase (Glucosamine-6-phosphate deaminase) (GNPDA) (GlcN6P deaminase) [Entomophthora muscae]|uniref:Glucosamine-6-phosphate isomerase (Glucosamine-6-phosphate deaminase) (GNPDA) (GlcN6P deaminase) n=1 Tax=Entomophthora muscae TaxID=34485 RepID=A0ACC2T8H7_9FUNG|nr:Glucosamine-6-phosphate isomerase (Glucosamine-6-phosphate deaminase) (GNPDA) (GlcN6P deaminase) [Entomophthora muscae]